MRFTVDDYYKMADAGIFAPGERVELIDGEVVKMTSISAPHAEVVRRASALFLHRLKGRVAVSVQLPVRLDDYCEPEPDISVVRPGSYRDRHPGSRDVLFVVEVSSSSLDYDRDVKTRIYAEAGVPEVWIADVEGAMVLVHRDPAVGRYTDIRSHERGESISPQAFPDVGFPIDEILG